MMILTYDNTIIVSYIGPPPDWAKDRIDKAVTDPLYQHRNVAFGEYLEGDDIREWDTTTGKRIVDRPVKTPEQLDAAAFDSDPIEWAESRCDQIDAELVLRLKAGFLYDGAMVPLDIGAQTAFLSQSDAIRDGVLLAGLVRTGDNRDMTILAENWGAFKLAALQAGTHINSVAWKAKESLRDSALTYKTRKDAFIEYMESFE